MNILSWFSSLLKNKPKSQEEMAARIVKRFGYTHTSDYSFYSDSYHGRTEINISSAGLKLKVYYNGFSETEFLKWPADKQWIKEFIRYNQA